MAYKLNQSMIRFKLCQRLVLDMGLMTSECKRYMFITQFDKLMVQRVRFLILAIRNILSYGNGQRFSFLPFLDV